MFCLNCGKEIPDNSKFCSHCGAVQQVKKQQDTVQKETTQQTTDNKTVTKKTKSKEKGKLNWKKVVVIVLVVLVARKIGMSVGNELAGSYQDDNQNNSSSIFESESVDDEGDDTADTTANGEYENIFLKNSIVEAPSLMFGMDSASFAIEEEGEYIEKQEFGYKDDVVLEIVYTLYFPVENYSGIDGLKNAYSKLEGLNCCTVDYHTGSIFYTVTITCEDLDREENVAELVQAGLIQGTGLISMSQTESGLLASGYVKK